jgi:hypothetical protein
MPKISLHIGLPHTGSTSIRALLGQNQASLAARGIHYPTGWGKRSHGKLAAYAMDESRLDDRRARRGVKDQAGLEDFRRTLEGEIARDFEAAKAERIVLSAEALSWDLRTPQEIGRLRDLLARHGTLDRLVVYLRPQAELMVARHANSLKRGRTGDVSLVKGLAERASYDYRGMLQRWSEAFGREAMRVRLLDGEAFSGGDLHEDVADALGLPLDALPVRPPPGNEGLDVQALAYLQLINKYLPPEDEAMSEASHALVDTLRKIRSGPKSTAPGWKLGLFQRLFNAGNCEVAKQYFGRNELFATAAPAKGRARLLTLTLDDAMAITAKLWIAREEELAVRKRRERRYDAGRVNAGQTGDEDQD